MTTTEARTEIGPPLFPDSPPPPAIHAAMAAVLVEIHGVPKSGYNEAQRYNFRGIDDMRAALRPLLGKHGISPRIHTLSIDREERKTTKGGTLWVVHVHLEMRFVASDGSMDTCDAIGEGSDSADKATAKAYTGAEKTILEKVFQISTADGVDPDAGGEDSQPKDESDWYVENGWASREQYNNWRGPMGERARKLAPKVREEFDLWKTAKQIDTSRAIPKDTAQAIQAWLEEHDVKQVEPVEPERSADCEGGHRWVDPPEGGPALCSVCGEEAF